MLYDYELSNYRGDFMAEDNQHGKWSIKSAKSTPQEITLEDEIHMLRQKMEQIFMEEQSFTSDIVIEISSLLDLKINEYMKTYPKKK
ncbi:MULTISPECIES: aspartyl-phosphate phosphatase Spo0E family protein [Paenibacillus]|uniref:Aspartyl-phosphate phosphatase Spo0E family protein n=1 Tax=Paenibacillus campinasensis TaxID=66347 RepID=A0A268EP64_9BACL|nr:MULTISPECIES: aspartyl-phosphate phosphatase Spo0E family protein [Paenibacillus]MUG66077.1 Spo0E family sporulation regulatory protein-aspartic acid phosphatase [Paenibacillus campinasensis]PAD74915.1 aspartyl-phosphate phosphatase Spo0E family protein [Paenibacillus campinasensis]PAK50064.1 aspartyl-phosphate phosphatase Spo0E family protein [Paenibacillus sp. 7541]